MNSKVKYLPENAAQHITAGPYSPVLEIRANRLVVISGQTCIAPDGSIPSDDFLEQARLTLDNCRRQLTSAGCTLKDVFKVNVYMTDLANWEQFNKLYEQVFPRPYPVRTALQVGLLPNLLIEIELWAATD